MRVTYRLASQKLGPLTRTIQETYNARNINSSIEVTMTDCSVVHTGPKDLGEEYETTHRSRARKQCEFRVYPSQAPSSSTTDVGARTSLAIVAAVKCRACPSCMLFGVQTEA